MLNDSPLLNDSPRQAVPVKLRAGRPLTRAQRTLWFSQQQQPTSPLQNMAEIARFADAVDVERLRQAFAAVVVASDSLRSRVVIDHDEPRIVQHPAYETSAITEVLTLPESAFEAWAADRVSRPIDCAVRSYDSVIVVHPEGGLSWYLALHHVITDATSSAIVFERAARVYNGQAPGLEPYYPWADARTAVATKRTERDAAFWKQRSAAPSIGALYTGELARTAQSHRVAVSLSDDLRRSIDTRFAADLRLLSDDLSWTSLLITATAVLLHRAGGVDDFSVGLPVHHRNQVDARSVIGPVMEVYPVDIHITEGQSYASLYRDISRSVLSTLQHAGTGGPPPSPDYRVVVNVLANAAPPEFSGVAADVRWMHSGATDPAHLVRVQRTQFNDTVELHLDLNEAACRPEDAPRVADHFGRIIEDLIADPDRSIGGLELPATVEQSVLSRWEDSGGNSPRDGGRAAPTTGPLVAALRSALADREDLAIVDGSQRLSGRELWARVVTLAHWLGSQGVGRGSRVAIDLPKSIDAVVAIYAVLAAGGSYVPLEPSHPSDRKRRLVERAGCALVLSELPTLDTTADMFAMGELSEPEPGDEAYLLFTSGSTGEPKGVPITHAGLRGYLDFALQAYVREGERPVAALFSALTFDLTVTSIFVPLLAGGRLKVIGADGPLGLRALADDDEITWLKATPSHLEVLARMADSRLGEAMQVLVVGGEAFASRLALRLRSLMPQVTIFNEYGPTEAVVGCMIHQSDDADLVARTDVPIGRPAPGVELRVLDRYQRRVPLGCAGELYIAHAGLTAGYLDDDTAGPFVDLDGTRFYRSGDLVRMVDTETLTYLGRVDEQLKIGGIRLDPTEVEHALSSHPGVARAVVRAWRPAIEAARQHCTRCGLPDNVPGTTFDAEGVCGTCHQYEAIKDQAQRWFRSPQDLIALRDRARDTRTGRYDAIHLLSGGKDSTFALYKLVELGFEVLTLTLDNGFISEGAKANVRRSVADLGVDHEFLTTNAMNDIFRDSLERHSNVCHGCYKTIYTLATARAAQVGAPLIVTGLSRGQLFETRLIPEQFAEGRFDPDAIDRATLQARRVYHRLDDGPNRLLDTSVFDRGADGEDIFERLQYVDFFRYVDVELSEMLDFLDRRAPWVRPSDTGRSTNCLINAAGIHAHVTEHGFHNYAVPYAWDVRLGHKTRREAMEELDDGLDLDDVERMLGEVGYSPRAREVLTAWVEPVAGAVLEPASLRAFLTSVLPSHAVPRAFVEVDHLPLTSNGKIDTDRLPAPQRLHRSSAALYLAAESALEQEVIAVWERLLNIEPISVEDDFFALGGDSLLALRMVVELSTLLGQNLPDDLGFTETTPRLLAVAINVHTGVVEDVPNRPAEAAPPLSAGEQSLLFEHFDRPEDPRYNVARCYHVLGSVDTDRFVAALRTVVARHVPLHWTYDEPRQQLSGDDAIDINVGAVGGRLVDIEEFTAWSRSAQRLPFDLENGPLGRCQVSRLADGTTGIALFFHHVSIDAGTFDTLWNQLDVAYGGGTLDPLAYDSADHAAWQRTQLTDSDREFWSGPNVASEPAGIVVDPTLDRRTEHSDGYVERAASFTREALATVSGTTGFTAVLAALAAVLRGHSDGPDIALAVSASTRDRLDASELVGYYLNTLPLIVHVDPSDTLGAIAGRATELMAGALAHRTYPYAAIVSDRRRLGLAAPSTAIMLAFEALAPPKLGTLAVSHEILDSGSAVTDATFFVQTRGSQVSLGLEYSGTFAGEQAARDLLDQFEQAIATLIAAPMSEVSSLARTQRGAGAPVPPEWMVGPDAPQSRSIPEAVAYWASMTPDADALVSAGVRMNYAELEQRACTIAQDLAAQGVGPGSFVGVVAERRPETVQAILGVLKSGAAYVPIDPDYPAHRVEQILEDAEPTLVLTPSLMGDLGTGGATTGAVPEGAETAGAQVDVDHPAYIIFTSGSTGRPKGVVVTHRNLASSTAARTVVYPGPVSRFLLLSSFSFDSSMVGLFWTLYTGGTLILPDPSLHDDLGHLADLVERERVTHLLALPSVYRLLLDERPEVSPLASLEVVIVAGEACAVEIASAHHQRVPQAGLWNEYGPTEATVWSHVYRVPPEFTGAAVPIGRPIPGATCQIVDEQGQQVGVGVAGELLIGGGGVTLGYHRRPELTSASFHGEGGDRTYRTGDRVRWMSDGNIEFLGRVDQQLKVRGHRVEPAEIEAVALGFEGVRRTVVDLAASGPGRAEQLTLWFEGDGWPEGGNEVRGRLRRYLADRLPAALVPSFVVYCESLPLSANGKIDRRSLPKPAAFIDVGTAMTEAPETDRALAGEREETLGRVWCEVLGVQSVRPADDFLALGGDSIMSMQMVSRLRRLGWSLSTREVFRSPTIAQLAQAMTPLADQAATDVDLVGLQASELDALAGILASLDG